MMQKIIISSLEILRTIFPSIIPMFIAVKQPRLVTSYSSHATPMTQGIIVSPLEILRTIFRSIIRMFIAVEQPRLVTFYSSGKFPADLLPDLLSRLPAKALVKLNFVSKSWLSLIEDPKFRSMHTNRLSDSTSSIAQVCFRRFSRGKKLEKLSHIIWSGGGGIDGVVEDFCTIPDVEFVRLVGSSNGVLCIGCFIDNKSRIILWNPLSRKYKIVPPEPRGRRTHGFFYRYGFGYDNANDDYKILSFEMVSACPLLYSRKMNTWRTIDYGFPATSLLATSVFYRGALHWISEDKSSLIAFDLANEEFMSFTLSLPEDLVNARLFIMRDGRVCMRLRLLGEGYELRLMVNYDEWLEFRFEPKSDVHPEALTPIAYVETPKPVMVMEWRRQGRDLVLYDVEEQALIFNSLVRNINGMVGCEVFECEGFPYIQTLELLK